MTAPNWESAPLVQDERTIPAVSGWESAPIVEEQPAVAAPAPALERVPPLPVAVLG